MSKVTLQEAQSVIRELWEMADHHLPELSDEFLERLDLAAGWGDDKYGMGCPDNEQSFISDFARKLERERLAALKEAEYYRGRYEQLKDQLEGAK